MGAVIAGIVLAALIVFRGDPGYTVKLRFINAAQLVRGNVVDIGGTNAGVVRDFEITRDGQAEVEISVDEKHAPLRRGTRAVVRSAGQSSVAGRYVQLMLPPENEAGDDIPDGGRIGVDSTTTHVDIDQFFNIFDKRTRNSLRGVYKGGARQYGGRGKQANRGLLYLNPQLAASTRLFEELRYEPPVLERFLVDSSRLVTALAERREHLTNLVTNLNATTRALGDEKLALAEAIGRLPPFLRQANTTYVNLRATLDQLDPFVEASKPVAKRLRPYLAQLRPFANDARPTVRDLSRLVRKRGRNNDITELNRTYPGLDEIAIQTRRRNGKNRRGAFPELSRALKGSAPIVAHGRPYTVDFVGWFDDFSHTGAYDALGSFSRSGNFFNVTSAQLPLPGLPDVSQLEAFQTIGKLRQVKRCPGASEEAAPDGSNVYSAGEQRELDCVESHRATGPVP